MLVLSRRIGQRVQVAANVWITVLAVHGDIVKLGFVAPSEVPIYREEIALDHTLEELGIEPNEEPVSAYEPVEFPTAVRLLDEHLAELVGA